MAFIPESPELHTSNSIPNFPRGLPDWQEHKLRELWKDVPSEYRDRLLTLSHQLPASEEELLATAREARRQGQIVRNQGAIQLLESWLADDDPANIAEQQETYRLLQKGLEEHPFTLREWTP